MINLIYLLSVLQLICLGAGVVVGIATVGWIALGHRRIGDFKVTIPLALWTAGLLLVALLLEIWV